jgi:hypothetical protein
MARKPSKSKLMWEAYNPPPCQPVEQRELPETSFDLLYEQLVQSRLEVVRLRAQLAAAVVMIVGKEEALEDAADLLRHQGDELRLQADKLQPTRIRSRRRASLRYDRRNQPGCEETDLAV